MLEAGVLAPVERAQAGIVLGKLGDPRPGVGLTRDHQGNLLAVRIGGRDVAVPAFVWCGAGGEMKSGEGDPRPKAFPQLPVFKLGEPKGREKRAHDSFTQFDCARITKPFFISKYPVTVAQYQLFLEAKGYEREFTDESKRQRLWTPEGWRWRTESRVNGPENYRPLFQTPNHPRVGVSWYEPRAYAAWLNSAEMRSHLIRDLGLPEGCDVEIRLPSAAEWELAARWNKEKGLADDRLSPWRGQETEIDLNERCNWVKAGIGSTSAVGLFPKGNGDCGAADLAGNVWEWCQTKWIDPNDENALNQYNSGLYDEDGGDGARASRSVLAVFCSKLWIFMFDQRKFLDLAGRLVYLVTRCE